MPADRRKSTSGLPELAAERPLTASCNSCRDRKVKCGGEKPRCDNCEKQGRPCEYRAKLKPGLKAGAGNVDSRVKDLQTTVRAHSEDLARLRAFLAPQGFVAGAAPTTQHFKAEALSPSPSSAGSPARDEPAALDRAPSASASSSSVRMFGHPPAPGASPPKPLAFDTTLGSSSTPSTSALPPPTSFSHHLPPPNQLLSQHQRQQHQQQHPFANPQTAAETLLGLSSSSAFMNGNEAGFGGAAVLSAYSQAAGPSTSRTDDVQMRDAGGDVGDMLLKQLGRRSSSVASTHYPPMQLSFDHQPPPSNGSWGLGGTGPTFGSGLGKSSFSPASRLAGSELPPPEVISELITLYYRHVDPWSPLVIQHADFPTQTTFDPRSPSQPSSSTRSSSAPSVLIQAIIFVSLRFSDHAYFRLNPTAKLHFSAVARDAVLMAAMRQMSVANLQALTVLALGWVHDEGGPQRWGGALSLLTGAVSHGRLGEEDQRDKAGSRLYHTTTQTSLFNAATSREEEEERRRLFWQIFCLDTYASVSTGFALSFDAADVARRRLPSRDGSLAEPHPDPADPVSLYSHYCSIMQILGEVHNFIRAPLLLSSVADTTAWKDKYRRLSDNLLAWYASLPEEIRGVERPDWDALQEGKGGMKVLVLAAFCATSIRLHSALAYPPVSSPSFLPSEAAASACVEASLRMARLASLVGEHEISRPGTALGPIDSRDLNPIFAWFVWIAARGLVAHAFIKRTPLAVAETIIFLEALNSLGAYWSTSKRYAKIITAALNESHARQPIPGFTYDSSVSESPPDGPGFHRRDSTSSVLADMRRTAFQALATLKEEDSEEDETDDRPRDGQQQEQNGGFGAETSVPMWKHSLLYPSSEPTSRSPGLLQQQQQQAAADGSLAEPYNFELPQDIEHWFHYHMFAEHDLPTYSVNASPVNSTIPLP